LLMRAWGVRRVGRGVQRSGGSSLVLIRLSNLYNMFFFVQQYIVLCFKREGKAEEVMLFDHLNRGIFLFSSHCCLLFWYISVYTICVPCQLFVSVFLYIPPKNSWAICCVFPCYLQDPDRPLKTTSPWAKMFDPDASSTLLLWNLQICSHQRQAR